MNQIYKVIWSRVKHCYVVVSEVAGRCGKNGAVYEKKSLSFHAFLCALALTGCLLPGVAEASFKGGNGAVVDPNNSIAVGDDAQTAGQYTVGPRKQDTGNEYLCHCYRRSGEGYRPGGDCHRIFVFGVSFTFSCCW